MQFADPKTDIAFKKIFGNNENKHIVIEFLNEVLDLKNPIIDIEILPSDQLPVLDGLKATSLDLKARDKEREFIVEMQVEKEKSFCKRALCYSSKSYVQQLPSASNYKNLKPVIFLGILDFTTFDQDSYFSRHLILNVETNNQDLKDFEFNFIELPKFRKKEDELVTTADKWIYFIKSAINLDHIPLNANTDALQLAYKLANKQTWSLRDLDLYESQEMYIGQRLDILETALADGTAAGIKIGIEKGKMEGKIEVAKNLLFIMSDTKISEITGLDLDTISNLRSEATKSN